MSMFMTQNRKASGELLMQSEMTLNTRNKGARRGKELGALVFSPLVAILILLFALLSTPSYQDVGIVSLSISGQQPICTALDLTPIPVFFRDLHGKLRTRRVDGSGTDTQRFWALNPLLQLSTARARPPSGKLHSLKFMDYRPVPPAL